MKKYITPIKLINLYNAFACLVFITCFNVKQTSFANTNSSQENEKKLVKATFTLRASEENISKNYYLIGNFNNWNFTQLKMIDRGNNLYSIEVMIEANQPVKYLYVMEGQMVENILPREIFIPDNEIFLGEDNFNEKPESAQQVIATVTFKVNMTQQTLSPNGVHIAGTFNSWNPFGNSLTNMGNGIYQTTITFLGNQTISYLFINGSSMNAAENVPASCGVFNSQINNFARDLALDSTNLILMPVCYADCGICVSFYYVNLTFKVNMDGFGVSPQGMHLAGSFNGFNPGALLMNNTSGTIYEVTLNIDTAQIIDYRFVNGDDTLATMETVPAACGVDDGTGVFNRHMNVPQVDYVLPLVCFSSCINCIPTSLNENSEALKIFPNPTNGIVKIIHVPKNTSVIILYNILGQPIFEKQISKEIENLEIDLSENAEGIYYLEFRNNDGKNIVPVVLQK